MVGASNFHLLGVGAEKSSLYRLGLLGFEAYLIIMERGRIKELLSPFAGLLVCSPARPIDRMNQIRRGDRAILILLLSLPPSHSLKGRAKSLKRV